jgi:replication factor A1
MEIKDLKANTGKVDLVLEVVQKEEPRSFEKFGKQGTVCSANVKDSTGAIKLTLWNEDVEKVSVGDKIHIENGWCSEFKGELQISSGKFGNIEVVGKFDVGVLTNDPKMLNPESSAADEDIDIIEDEETIE